MIYLSIIITTYNNEQYIKKCIESIKDKEEIEIIIVNDGSTDKTKAILKEYKHIKVINLKNNQGVSHARNIGIKEIKGKYFTFIDGDDYILPHTIKTILKDIKKYKPDTIIYNYYEKTKDLIKSKYNYTEEILTKEETINQFLKDKISPTVWSKVYNEKYKNIKFNEQLEINEDCDYTIKILSNAKKTVIKKEYIYVYNKNINSLTSKYTCEQIKNNDYIKYINKDIKKYKNYKEYRELYELKKIHLYSQCKNKRYRYLKEDVDKTILKKLLKQDISKSYKLEIIIYLISIRLHLMLFKTYMRIRKNKRKCKHEIYNNNNSIQ